MGSTSATWTTLESGSIVRTQSNYEWTAFYRRIINGKTEKIRIRLHRNFYEFQTWAVTEKWDGDQWREVCRWIGGDPMLTDVCATSVFNDKDLPKAETAVSRFAVEALDITFRIIA